MSQNYANVIILETNTNLRLSYKHKGNYIYHMGNGGNMSLPHTLCHTLHTIDLRP